MTAQRPMHPPWQSLRPSNPLMAAYWCTLDKPANSLNLAQYETAATAYIRVLLGKPTDSLDDSTELLAHYMALQQKDSRICLETARHSLVCTPERALQIHREFPGIRFSLNIAEWVQGLEITPEKLPRLRRLVRQLGNIAVVIPEFATAEFGYERPIRYRPRAFFNASVMIETLYSLFYRWLWRKIPAPRLNPDGVPQFDQHQWRNAESQEAL